jgi:hypothetical protein
MSESAPTCPRTMRKIVSTAGTFTVDNPTGAGLKITVA